MWLGAGTSSTLNGCGISVSSRGHLPRQVLEVCTGTRSVLVAFGVVRAALTLWRPLKVVVCLFFRSCEKRTMVEEQALQFRPQMVVVVVVKEEEEAVEDLGRRRRSVTQTSEPWCLMHWFVTSALSCLFTWLDTLHHSTAQHGRWQMRTPQARRGLLLPPANCFIIGSRSIVRRPS